MEVHEFIDDDDDDDDFLPADVPSLVLIQNLLTLKERPPLFFSFLSFLSSKFQRPDPEVEVQSPWGRENFAD